MPYFLQASTCKILQMPYFLQASSCQFYQMPYSVQLLNFTFHRDPNFYKCRTSTLLQKPTYRFDTPNNSNILLRIDFKFQVMTKALLRTGLLFLILTNALRLRIRNVDKDATFYRFETLSFHKCPTLQWFKTPTFDKSPT